MAVIMVRCPRWDGEGRHSQTCIECRGSGAVPVRDPFADLVEEGASLLARWPDVERRGDGSIVFRFPEAPGVLTYTPHPLGGSLTYGARRARFRFDPPTAKCDGRDAEPATAESVARAFRFLLGDESPDNVVRPHFPEPPLPPAKVATFTLGTEGFQAEIDEVLDWTQGDWRNLVLAAARTAQMHGADLPTILAELGAS